MRTSALLALVLVALPAEAQGRFDRFCSRSASGRSDRGFQCAAMAYFEAFPASGAGTTTACSTTAPTGAKGEALTFTRASSGTCTKTAAGGLATTGIADGDLVVLSTNVARVEYDSAGTLGLLVEAERTNSCLHSEEIDNAAWVKRVANTVWANDAGAPDGTQTADAVFAAATGADVTGIYQTMIPVGASSCSWYARSATPSDGGTAQPGIIDITTDNGAGTFACTTCSYVADSWSLCTRSLTVVGAGGSLMLGNDSRVATCGNPARPSQDFLLWGVQCELGAYATSYIPTTTVAMARAAEVSTVNGSTFPTATYCIGATIETEWSVAQNAGVVEGQVGAASGVGFFLTAGFVRAQNLTAGADNSLDYTFTPTAGVPVRLTTRNDGNNQSTYKNGVLVAGPTAKTHADSPWSTTTGIGYSPALPAALSGIITRVKVDSDVTRCE